MTSFDQIFDEIQSLELKLVRGSEEYSQLELKTKECVKRSGFFKNQTENFGKFGAVTLPFFRMGQITTLDLFGLDEMLLFTWYRLNIDKYHKVGDLGANVGLHSILMAKLGWLVNAYEADPETTIILKKNLELNSINNVIVNNVAVSSENGQAKFIRIKNNLTGSHLAGAKKNPYGEMETFEVSTIHIKDVMTKCDFFKMDVEGSEASIIKTTGTSDWKSVDAVIEIGSSENREIIFKHFSEIGVKMYSQKNYWRLVSHAEQLPSHHSEGSVFCSSRRSFLEIT